MVRRDLLYEDSGLASFYDLENGWAADTIFCRDLAADARSVLDIGCGTGLLAASLGKGREVVGVDSAKAMLAIARARPGGDRCRFIVGDARSVRLGRRFDLVTMTGHAFQVFLTREDRLAALRTVAAHLSAGGTFIFDSRNPEIEEWREWVPEASVRFVDHPVHGRTRAWNDVEHDADSGIVTYSTFYEVEASGMRLAARSSIAFPPHAEIMALCAEAGLAVERVMGDWAGGAFAPGRPEIIPVGGLADPALRQA